MFKKLLLTLPLMALTACAYTVDGSVQDIKFVTPGAKDAQCQVIINGLKYRVSPPETIPVYKNKNDMKVDCKAPGNRRKIIYVEADLEKSSLLNVGNAGVGAAWDYASNALFKYPDIIEVNFTDTPTKPNALPVHNNPDIRQPESYNLEEFSPGQPRMNADRTAKPIEILPRQRGQSSNSSFNSGYTADESGAFTDGPVSGGKGEVMSPSTNMIDAMNPAAAASEPSFGPASVPAVEQAGSEPIPLFPGE